MTLRDAAAGVWLAPHIHVARDGADLVVLDVEADAYYCLPDGASAAAIEAGGARLVGLSPEVAAALASIGATVERSVPRRGGEAVAPARDLYGRLAREVRAGEVWDFIASILEAVVRFRRQDLEALIGGWGDGRERDLAILERRALVFRTLWPWSPVQGACLFQALVLRLFVRRGGAACDWVFGVRTWPFSAHCWLQSGDLVLNDLAERVGAYRPILVT